MTLRAELLKEFYADFLWMKFLVVSSMVLLILVAGLVHLADETVANFI